MDQEETKSRAKEDIIKSNLEQSQRLEEGMKNYHTQSGTKIRESQS